MPPKKSPKQKPWEHAKTGAGSHSDPLATRFVESLSYDRRLYPHDIAGSIAHARMLAATKLITANDLKAIESGLNEIRDEIDSAPGEHGAGWPGWNDELEDVHMCIEAALIEKVGDPGRKLHTGRSRNDQVALALKLWINHAAADVNEHITELMRSFLALAERDGRHTMPSYTHLQRAQPIAVGGELIAWLEAIDRAAKRIESLRQLNLENPLGSGAIAGSSLPLDREHTAAALDVGPPARSSIDATASRDAAIDFTYALSMLAMTLSRWANQWITYASTEFGFITLDGRYTTGSSMMPQKANPDMLELIRGRCGDAYGRLTALLTMCHALTVGYNRDLQEDKRHLFAAFDCVRDCTVMAGRIVATTRFNPDRINQSLDAGYLDATSLAEYLVTQSIPFRTAHQIVGALVAHCQQNKLTRLSELKLTDFNRACESAGQPAACQPDLFDWLDPRNVVKRYQSLGNAGLPGFETELTRWQQRLK